MSFANSISYTCTASLPKQARYFAARISATACSTNPAAWTAWAPAAWRA